MVLSEELDIWKCSDHILVNHLPELGVHEELVPRALWRGGRGRRECEGERMERREGGEKEERGKREEEGWACRMKVWGKVAWKSRCKGKCSHGNSNSPLHPGREGC